MDWAMELSTISKMLKKFQTCRIMEARAENLQNVAVQSTLLAVTKTAVSIHNLYLLNLVRNAMQRYERRASYENNGNVAKEIVFCQGNNKNMM